MNKPVLYLAVFTLFSLSAYAQGAKKGVPQAMLGSVDPVHPSCEQVLANPKIVVSNTSCNVTGFIISITPPGHNTMGPFHVNGNEIPDQQLSTIKRYKKKKVNITIEEIHIDCGGTIKTALPISLDCDN